MLFLFSDQPSSGTMPAIHRALLSGDNQNPVRVTMHQARDRRIPVFRARVEHLTRRDDMFRG